MLSIKICMPSDLGQNLMMWGAIHPFPHKMMITFDANVAISPFPSMFSSLYQNYFN